MQNQRNRKQGHQLIKQIEGDHTAGKDQTVQNAVNHQIETEKPCFFLFVFHVRKCVKAGKHPNHIHHDGKQPSQGIHTEIQIQIFAEGEQHQFCVASEHNAQAQGCGYGQSGAGNGQKHISALKAAFQQNPKAQQNRKQN